MLCLTMRIKKNDEINWKRLEKALKEFLKKSKVSGAKVWLVVGGFGKSGKSTLHLEGADNQPAYDDWCGWRKIDNRAVTSSTKKNGGWPWHYYSAWGWCNLSTFV